MVLYEMDGNQPVDADHETIVTSTNGTEGSVDLLVENDISNDVDHIICEASGLKNQLIDSNVEQSESIIKKNEELIEGHSKSNAVLNGDQSETDDQYPHSTSEICNDSHYFESPNLMVSDSQINCSEESSKMSSLNVEKIRQFDDIEMCTVANSADKMSSISVENETLNGATLSANVLPDPTDHWEPLSNGFLAPSNESSYDMQPSQFFSSQNMGSESCHSMNEAEKGSIDGNGCVMQTVVQGELQPLTFGQPVPPVIKPSESSTNLFAGISDVSVAQDIVPQLIAGNSVEVVQTLDCLNGDVDAQLTDLSCSSFQYSVNPMPLQVCTMVVDSEVKPTFVKMLPLKNGHSGWTMEDLRYAIAQNGSVVLRLSATPDGALESCGNDFSALFLDVSEGIEETVTNDRKRKFSNDEVDNHLSPVPKKSTMTTWPSVSSNLSDASDSAYISHPSEFTDIKTGGTKQSSHSSGMHVPLSSQKGKKRGRPALHGKGDLIGQIPLETLSSVMDPKGRVNLASIQAVGSIFNKKLSDKHSPESLPVGYKKLLSLTCIQCGSIFRNKGGLASHIKSKHKVFKVCRICSDKVHLQDKYSYRRHLLKTHKDKSQLNCYKCDVSFKVMLHLKRHNRIVHEDSDSSELSSCEIGSDSDSEKVTSTDVNRKPTILGKVESRVNETFQKPTVIDHPKDEDSESGNESDNEDSEADEVEEKKKFFCTDCEAGFSHKFKLAHHMQASHGKEKSKDSEMDLDDLVCKICHKHCRNYNQLEHHLDQHKRLGTENNLSIEREEPSNREGRLTGRLKTLQLEANKIMGNKKRLGRPKSKNAKDKKGDWPSYVTKKGRIFHCTKCNLTFPREKSMTYHLKKIHETLYPFRACPDCDKIFRSSGPYIRHRSQHRVKHCPIEGCKARYKNARMIRKHQKISHPEFPHRCHRCVKLFQRANQLEKHLKEDHVQTESLADENEASEEESEGEPEEVVLPKKDESLPLKRSRKGPLSYQEVEEEEETFGRRRKQRKFKQMETIEPMLTVTRSRSVLPNEKEQKKTNHSTVYRKSKKLSTLKSKLHGVQFKPKKSGQTKKVTTSWTAALKAQYNFNKKAGYSRKLDNDTIGKSKDGTSAAGITESPQRLPNKQRHHSGTLSNHNSCSSFDHGDSTLEPSGMDVDTVHHFDSL